MSDSVLVGKHMDIVPPLGWNWTSEDWRIFNFVRGLSGAGGVVRGEHEDIFVLINYDKKKPSRSTWIKEVVKKEVLPGLSMAQVSDGLQQFAEQIREELSDGRPSK